MSKADAIVIAFVLAFVSTLLAAQTGAMNWMVTP